MLQAMYEAEVGDDVYGEDPTINKLEKEFSELLGKDRAVFMTSGTQSNLSAILSHCGRGEEMIVGNVYHTALDEAAGASVLGGIAISTIEVEEDLSIKDGTIKNAVKPDDPHYPISKLLCLENTSQGRAIPFENLKRNHAEAKEMDLSIHLDGARLFNAIEDLKCEPNDVVKYADSVSICFSKGLGAPAGSILCFPESMEHKVRRQRKILGGALRQVGVLGAACLYAVKNNIKRLKEDHERAGFRMVPNSPVRKGSFVGKNAVLMPCYVNIGAYIDEGTMIDTFARAGSCCQIGKNCHISAGSGVGGVLEPAQALPTIIEDNVFLGAMSEVVEGVIVGEGSVLSMGMYIGQSTKIVDRKTGNITYGKIPPYSVVVPGSLPDKNNSAAPSLYCAVIIKQVDEKTRSKTSINDLLRD